MSTLFFSGALTAAFIAGVAAFFAPCCSGVMVPSYIAAISGGSRWRMTRMTLLYVAGVATLIWPITLGAAGLSEFAAGWHLEFYLLGGLMMLAVAYMLLRGSMMAMTPLPQPDLDGSPLSVYLLGLFAGAATACCAPSLAGAVTLSALGGTLWGGVLLGAAYILGMVTPLIPIALLVQSARKRVRDVRVTFQLAGRTFRTSAARLTGAIVFGAFGLLFIYLAAIGQDAPTMTYQRRLNVWVTVQSQSLPSIPNLALLTAIAATLSAAMLARRRHARKDA